MQPVRCEFVSATVRSLVLSRDPWVVARAMMTAVAVAMVEGSGGFDRNATVVDVRAAAADWRAAARWSVNSDVECVSWDPHNPNQFLVSTDSGNVTCHDARQVRLPPLPAPSPAP